MFKLVIGILVILGAIYLCSVSASGINLTVPTTGGPTAEGIGMFMKLLGL